MKHPYSSAHGDNAPGWPGIPAKWTSACKNGVGTAQNPASAVWFTLSHGIINEVYYPRVDQACTRDMEFIVTDGRDFFSEEKRHCAHHLEYIETGVPAYKLTNTCKSGNYVIEKEIINDPFRSSLLQNIKFKALKRSVKDYKLHVLLAPHIANFGSGNNAWIAEYKGVPMLFAEREGIVLALACSANFIKRSVGYVGESDGWQDLVRHKMLKWNYSRAENGNVALTAEIDLTHVDENGFTLALGFGRNESSAAQVARASLVDGYEHAKENYIREWRSWQNTLMPFDSVEKSSRDLYRVSTFVLRSHAAKRLPGGLIASLSIPWGYNRGDDDIGGYHLVWPRDLGETAGGLLAAKAWDETRKVLNYLMATQEAEGHWPQNMWLDGSAYWPGIQMDEVAFPVLIVDMARRKGFLEETDLRHFWPMVEKAISYLVKHGPVTMQDRWEENAGYTPFTIATEISALLAGADLADIMGKNEMAAYMREVADSWNESIEDWMYVTDTPLSRKNNVDGYYVRVMPPKEEGRVIQIKNLPEGQGQKRAEDVVSPDALALVRFGLRAADDPRIVNTVKVIDDQLKIETPFGPCWYRYNFDGYGETEDGGPYAGVGKGRLWPLLTGERAHYELAAGRVEEAKRLLHCIEAFANEGGMLPEQVWDTHDIPSRDLYFGKPTGSAMPLVWAHSEYIKLIRSIKEKKVFDMPPQTHQRYVVEKKRAAVAVWTFSNKTDYITGGKKMRIETMSPAIIHWTTDNWKTVHDTYTKPSGFGHFIADLQTDKLPAGTQITFTFYWSESNNWENKNFTVDVREGSVHSAHHPVFIQDAIKNILDKGSKISELFLGRNLWNQVK